MVSNQESYTQEKILKIERELRKMEHNLYEKYCEVGKGILEKAEQESKNINSIVDQIIETRRKLVELKLEKNCPTCEAFNDHNSIYCKRCGARLPDAEYTKEDNNGTKQ